MRRLGYSGAKVARHLGTTTSCVNRHMVSGELRETAQFIADLWAQSCTFLSSVLQNSSFRRWD
ncbi:hypothetical protein JXA88_13265 [Candidatus Fermentibacteria bacterium]|nr:hypothetical protein [Candidatus Fermentibacteria bacterium]